VEALNDEGHLSNRKLPLDNSQHDLQDFLASFTKSFPSNFRIRRFFDFETTLTKFYCACALYLATNNQHNWAQQIAAISKCLWRQQNIDRAIALAQTKETLKITHLS